MTVSGFTIIRNGEKFDFPYREAIRSILPLVQEMIINVGIGEDHTLAEIEKIKNENPNVNFVIFESDWQLNSPKNQTGGNALAIQTNLAKNKCSGDWCFYIQADEVIHENDHSMIQSALNQYQNDPQVEGLCFQYLHFYGSFDIIRVGRAAYRREIRIIKNNKEIQSVGDAQSFKNKNGEKINAALIPARIFHYGWVRPPEKMREKTLFMDQLYHGKNQSNIPATGENYKYKKFWGLRTFKETHPQYMFDRIKNKNWNWDLKNSPFIWKWSDLKKIILDSFEFITNIRLFEFKNYKIVKKWKVHDSIF